MDANIFFHHLLTLLFFLVLPRLPTLPASGNDEMEVLVLGRVGYIPAKGLYACFTRMAGAAPDLTLQYSASYTYGPSKKMVVCNGDVSQHYSQLDDSAVYCLPPCPGMEEIYPDPMYVVITGHDRITKNVQAALMERFTLPGVTPTVIQPGEGVVAAQWAAAHAGRIYRVQLWHHPQTLGEATGASIEAKVMEVTKTEVGGTESEGIGRAEYEGVGMSLKAGHEEVEGNQAVVERPVQTEEEKDHDASVTGNVEVDEVMNNWKLLNDDRIVARKEKFSEISVGETLEASTSEAKLDLCGVMSNETLVKIRQCYHDLDKDDDVDDDDDDDTDEDDDHEEDSDDFIKFMRWRKCVALYAPCSPTIPESTATVLQTSKLLDCMAGLCVYYFTDVPASGSISVEVMDITDAFVSSSQSPPTPVQKWRSLTIDTIVISSEGIGPYPRPKTMRIEMPAIPKGGDKDSSETQKLQYSGDIAVETGGTKLDYQAVIINGDNHSEVLGNLSPECDPLGGVCSVSALHTLVDPEQRGPVSDMFLLFSNYESGLSSLVSITDVHLRVRKVTPDTVVVLWDREPSIPEFLARVVHDNGESSDTVIIPCSKRGTDCLATFSNLSGGLYRAEVSYAVKTKVVISTQFFVENGLLRA